MKIKYVKANPTENKTLLVQSSVPRELQPSIAGAMLSADPDAEQVGFFEMPSDPRASVRLQMMGGEFCGNASISAAAEMAEREGIKPGERREILMEVSGAEGIVKCLVQYDGKVYTGTVDMPLPKKIEKTILKYKENEYPVNVVFLPGIIHIILDKNVSEKSDPYFMESAIKEWSGLFEEEAVGLIGFDEESCTITPLVYVRSTDSLYWERGCGTGTAAAGVYMSYKYRQSVDIPVKQPGGIITAETGFDGTGLKSLKITGKVFFEDEGYFEI
ncbi:MAG: hypothetical protein IJC41_05015 [Firmicutes bacterium]|nr:hypothetical protein [Bacillota bacterium]